MSRGIRAILEGCTVAMVDVEVRNIETMCKPIVL